MLGRARTLGFLGPGPVEAHVAHAGAFVSAWAGSPPERVLDLGSGGGVPGLVLAMTWTSSTFVLLDAGQRRVAFLAEAVSELGLDDRVDVVGGRAEAVARQPEFRGVFAAVTARGFGSPAVTAECAAGFLRAGGALLVSEPPDSTDATGRWPDPVLAELGMTDEGLVHRGPAIRRLRQTRPCPDRYPRRVGIPAKRPLGG